MPELQMDGDMEGRDYGENGRMEGVEVETEQDGWQDMQTYEREQEITEGELGARHTGLEDGGEVPRVKAPKSVLDKNDRKKKKAERNKQSRREKNDKAREKASEV